MTCSSAAEDSDYCDETADTPSAALLMRVGSWEGDVNQGQGD